MENKKTILYSKKGALTSGAKWGVDLGLFAIFVLAIGLTIVNEIYTNLSFNSSGGTSGALLTGISSTVLGYAPLIVVAVFIYGISRLAGLV